MEPRCLVGTVPLFGPKKGQTEERKEKLLCVVLVTERRKRRNSSNCFNSRTEKRRSSADNGENLRKTVSFYHCRYFHKKQTENLLMRRENFTIVQKFCFLSQMTSLLSFTSVTPHINFRHRNDFCRPNYRHKIHRFRCNGENPRSSSSTTQESEPENALLKVAWYGSELLGIAASFFRSPSSVEAPERALELAGDESGAVDRAAVVETIKEDFQRSYFVTGNLTLSAYEDDCEFADPAGSFRGLRRFKRNCTNFGSLIQKSNMKLMKWEDFEDKGIGHWRFSCVLSFPWKPILSATGYTEYYFDPQSGKVCRHVEHWNVPKMALLKQILRPSRGFWSKKTEG